MYAAWQSQGCGPFALLLPIDERRGQPEYMAPGREGEGAQNDRPAQEEPALDGTTLPLHAFSFTSIG